jgi:phage portal protein BeeE
VGWLTGPRDKVSKQTAVIDGRQGFMSIPSGLGGQNLAGMLEQDGSFSNYASSGYGRNELVYACIRYRAESLPQSVLRVYAPPEASANPNPSGNGPAVDDHRLRRLFENPNPVCGEFEFFELSMTYKDLAGTCFWMVVNGRDGLPSQIWPLRPDLVGVLPGGLPTPANPTPFTWIYRPDPGRPELYVPIPDAGDPRAARSPAFIIRIRYPNPNPNDPGWRYFGQPPLRAAARATTLDNGATDFVDGLLRNHAMPSVVIETENEITPALHKRLRAMWREAFGGVRRNSDPAWLQKGMKLHQLGLTLPDLEFPDLREVSETRICAAFAVEPILVGAKVGLLHNAYKDYREARLSFWEEAMFSEQRRFLEPVRSFLLPRFNGVGRRRVQVGWDNSGVLALKESETTRWERATNALARGGITRNDFRQLVGLLPVPSGDVFLTPAGIVPQPAFGDGPAPPVLEAQPAAKSLADGYGLLAAEYGVELSKDELAALEARQGVTYG